jgi:hypothetical protein
MTDFLPFALAQLVEAFRAQFSESEAPVARPLDIENIVLNYSLLSVQAISALTVEGVQHWLQQRQCPMTIQYQGADRNLYGCLVVDCASGHGYIFVERDCSESQRRFTIAHELAHYLRDYCASRERALNHWGEAIRPVLDGQRPATIEERLDAILQHVPLGIYQHLMLRDANRQIVRAETQDSEICADRIALELLAPHRQLLKAIGDGHQTMAGLRARLQPSLQTEYGLPEVIARRYGIQLAAHFGYHPTIRDWFR